MKRIIFLSAFVFLFPAFAKAEVIQFKCIPELEYFSIEGFETDIYAIKEANDVPVQSDEYEQGFVEKLKDKYNIYTGNRWFTEDLDKQSFECKLKNHTLYVKMKNGVLGPASWRTPGKVTGSEMKLLMDDKLIYDSRFLAGYYPTTHKISYSNGTLAIYGDNEEKLVKLQLESKVFEKLSFQKNEVLMSLELGYADCGRKIKLPFKESDLFALEKAKEYLREGYYTKNNKEISAKIKQHFTETIKNYPEVKGCEELKEDPGFKEDYDNLRSKGFFFYF